MGVQDQNQRRPGDALAHLFEAGLDVVGGAAGARPGSQRRSRRRSGSGVGEIGRWLGDRMSWLLDDEDWDDEWQRDQPPLSRQEPRPPATVPTRRRPGTRPRRPLGVIPHPAPPLLNEAEPPREEWPDDQLFRVERWERGEPTAAEPPPDRPAPSLAARVDGSEERKRPRSSRRRLPRA